MDKRMTPNNDGLLSQLEHTYIDFKQTSEVIRDPLIFERADGLYVWDIHGKRYFDAIGGIFVACLGHRHPRVMEAMRKQMDKITLAPPLHGTTDVNLRFVEKLGSVTPGNLKFIKSFSGGSESVEAAFKFARQYHHQTGNPTKYKFISLYYGYHGGTMGALAATGSARHKVKFEPQMGGFLKAFSPIQLRDQFASWEETNRFCARMVEELIVSEGPETIAGMILEPLSNLGGVVTPTEEYFQMLRQICDRYGILLIFDEIVTGFGKTGNMFAAQTFNVIPDIICAGKGLSSGAMPLGAIMARQNLAEAFHGPADADIQFFHGHTYSGNPLGAAVGIAVLDELVEKQLDKRARQLGEYLVERLEGLKRYGVVREVRGKGLFRGVEFVEDPATNRPFPAERKLGEAFRQTAIDNGIILRIHSDWFSVAPPLIVEESDIDEMCDLIELSLEQALARLKREPLTIQIG
jgi:adenosylmethionine-8-amino-7-oxononanoate aminotransferase